MFGDEADKKYQRYQGGARRKLGRISVSFVSTLFEIEKNMKRYVGGLVHSMDQRLYIALLAFGR